MFNGDASRIGTLPFWIYDITDTAFSIYPDSKAEEIDRIISEYYEQHKAPENVAKTISYNDNNYDLISGPVQTLTALKKLCLTAYTETLFDRLNNDDLPAFIEKDGYLYAVDAAKDTGFSTEGDTYRVLYQTKSEVRFLVTEHQTFNENQAYVSTHIIAMTLTSDGWRLTEVSGE